MLTEVLVSICACVFFYLSYRYAVGRPSGFPPGPPRLPVFGSYLFMMMANFKYLHKGILKFSKWYKTDIVGFFLGSLPVVAVHSADGVREVLSNKDFDGRPRGYLTEIRDPKLEIRGIFFQDGPLWHEQRRFILRYLRDFGFGRRFQDLELIMQAEMSEMLDLIRNGPRFEHEKQIVQTGGYRVLLPFLFSPFSLNSFLHLIYNESHPRAEQADLIKLAKLAMQFQREGDAYGKMLSIIPWTTKVFPNWSSYNLLMESNVFMYNFFASFIDRHIETYDEAFERNFLDLYIKEMKQGGVKTTFSREQLIMSLLDFSLPVITSISAQLAFLVQYLILYPNVLKRVQNEIDEVVGNGRLPTLDDSKSLHYTNSVIRECLRIETLIPSNVPHKALVDTQLMGYDIPKGTIVVPSLYAYHADNRIWEDAEKFRPERFLDDEGKLSLRKDISLPFSAGRRACPGETFARSLLFLITSALCQNFNFVLGPGDELPDLSKNLSGFSTSPPDFWVQLEDRH